MGKGKMRLILLRGISGSGKSTFIERFLPDAYVCSADHFFINEGVYQFNRRQLGIAHKVCQDKFKQALKDRVPLIVIDNTNTMLKEMTPYVKPAKRQGYRIECVRLNTPLEIAHGRNTHGVPFAAVRAMIGRMVDVPKEWNETIVSGTE